MAFEPDGGELGHRQASTPGLGHQLDADLEPGRRGDPHRPDEVHVIGLERVGGVAGAHVGQGPQRQSRHAGEQALEKRPAHLLAPPRIPRGGGYDDPSFDQADQLVDLLRIVTAVGHGDHDHVRLGPVGSVPDGPGGTGAHVVHQEPHPWIRARRTSRRRVRWCPPASRRRPRSPRAAPRLRAAGPTPPRSPPPRCRQGRRPTHAASYDHSVASKVPDVHHRLIDGQIRVDGVRCADDDEVSSFQHLFQWGQSCRRRRRRDPWSTPRPPGP